MKKTNMMKKNYEFKRVFEKGEYFAGKYLAVFIKKENKQDKILLGIAIGVKIAKAVKRNHIKRLIRESYNLIEDRINGEYSIVILWKKNQNINNANFINIKTDMENIFNIAKII